MTSLGSGVRVMETEHGHGPQVNYEDTVTLHYSVEALEGAVIYDSVETTVVAGRMEPVPGLDAAVRTLREGSRAKVILPSEQAYGVPGDGNRIGHSMELLFDVKILKVRKLK
jgi:FKBP-type peptidyl-prolyl cis-trans isomerase